MNIKCPSCGCTGFVVGLAITDRVSTPMQLPCFDCNGTGFVDAKIIIWKRYGKFIKKWHIDKGWSLRTTAKRLHIDPSNLSKAERGFINPCEIIKKLKLYNPEAICQK